MTIYARLDSRLPQIMGDLGPKVKEALGETAEAIADGARERVPVDSGALRDAIHTEEVEDGWVVVAGDQDAFYGHIVEHGSTRVPARPFLTPATEAERARHLERVADALEDL